VVEIAPAEWATADEIRRRGFSSAAEGYDADEVREYLSRLGDMFAGLTAQLSQLRRQEGVGVGELATRMADVLREAEEHAAQIRDAAEREADNLVADARTEAERALTEARGKVEQLLQHGQEEAGRLRSTARDDAERLLQEAGAEAERRADDTTRRLAEARALGDALRSEIDGFRERLAALAGAPLLPAPAPPAGPPSAG